MSLEPSAMSPASREHYKELLRSRSRALRESIGKAADMSEAEAERLREVEQAEQRLVDGSYGKCEDCGEPIERERLEMIPEARRCAPDHEEYEHKRAEEAAASPAP